MVTHTITFPSWRPSQAQKIALGPKLCCVGEGWCGKIMVVVVFFLTLSDMSKLVILLLQYCPGSSLLEAWSSTMALSSK